MGSENEHAPRPRSLRDERAARTSSGDNRHMLHVVERDYLRPQGRRFVIAGRPWAGIARSGLLNDEAPRSRHAPSSRWSARSLRARMRARPAAPRSLSLRTMTGRAGHCARDARSGIDRSLCTPPLVAWRHSAAAPHQLARRRHGHRARRAPPKFARRGRAETRFPTLEVPQGKGDRREMAARSAGLPLRSSTRPKRPKSWRRSRLRRFRLIPRTSRQPRAVQEV